MSPPEAKPAWQWSKQREWAAQLVADDALSNDEIAAKIGVSAKQLERWKEYPEFAARVEAHVKAWREKIFRRGLVIKERRIESLIGDFEATDIILAERGAQLEGDLGEGTPYAGGARTGFITRDFKGKDAETPVYSFDAALLRERRELRRQIAQELGEWDERRMNLKLPAIQSARDVIAAVSAVVSAVASGEIMPREGQALAGLLDATRKSIETADLERRLAEVEEHLKQSGAESK